MTPNKAPEEKQEPVKPPKHKYWGAGEVDCPRDIKTGNGELHSLRCKVCGETDPPDEFCWNAAPQPQAPHSDDVRDKRNADAEALAVYAQRIMQLEKGYDYLRTVCNRMAQRAEDARNKALEEAARRIEIGAALTSTPECDILFPYVAAIRALHTDSEK